MKNFEVIGFENKEIWEKIVENKEIYYTKLIFDKYGKGYLRNG